MKVAVIERGKFRGTCVNTGCIPTKTMVASAYAAHMARRAAEYGVAIAGGVSMDMKARKDRISGKSNAGLETSLKSLANCTVYDGHARFESPKEVAVGANKLTAERIFINVGGRAVVPEIPGFGGEADAAPPGLNGKQKDLANFVYAVAEFRVGSIGQDVNAYLNKRGQIPSQAMPWVWSVIQFDTNGHFNPLSPLGNSPIFQIFPTYNIYTNGTLTNTLTQSGIENLIQLDATSFYQTPAGP